MEPLHGGSLANPPPEVEAIWRAASVHRSPADWALQWLWNKPEIATVLSGMTTMEQVLQNLASAERSAVRSLSEEELATIRNVQAKYEELRPIPCTMCGYCMPCPNGVDIPRNFEIYNLAKLFAKSDRVRKVWYRIRIPDEAKASVCIQCRECEDKCPQDILVSEWMPRIHGELSEK
jgi:predicted aldo/keto reductase-like oxidoreductase